MTPRRRSRYASDDQIRRAARLALEMGVALVLGADGSVRVLGRLDSRPPDAAASPAEGETPDEALAAWEAKNEPARRA